VSAQIPSANSHRIQPPLRYPEPVIRKTFKRAVIVLAVWLPFFAIWMFVGLTYARDPFRTVLVGSLISIGSAGLLGIPIWYACRRWPLPPAFKLSFYLLEICSAALYGIAWTAATYGLEYLRAGMAPQGGTAASAVVRQLLFGMWFYSVIAGISYAVQTRDRLHEKEAHAAHAEALASAARLDAVRARLNPHFLFNALHTLAALSKFRPAVAEGAIERLGDMLRYTLQENGRELVGFSEEYDFTKQYLDFEQLRYEDRLKVHLQTDPKSFDFELPPFSIQTLAENAVHHAIAVRPEGGSIWISSTCEDDMLTIKVRDDGCGHSPPNARSNRFGLKSLRERLDAAYGALAELTVRSDPAGFEACLRIPANVEGAQHPQSSEGRFR
jgi:two-component system, LytTR family, sensor kinase